MAMMRTEHVTRWYAGGNGKRIYAIQDVSIEIPEGSLTILRGRSGSGKTTLLNLLSGLDIPSEGVVYFGTEKLAQMSQLQNEQMRRTQMGFVFQSVALIPVMNAFENVDFALRLAGTDSMREKRIREVLARVGMENRMNHMVHQMSGGEQQRVAIARAVVHKPKVIFADEPTGALDTASGLAVMELFLELVKEENITIVMTTHDTNLMEYADVLYEVEDGCIVGER